MKKVREGYKMTELGEIPNEWKVKRLEDISDNNDRYSFAGGPFGSDLKSEHYTEEGIRVIQLQNMGDGYFNNNYKIYTSIDKADELFKCNIYPNELIIAKMAEPVARACKIPNYEKRYLMCSDGIRLLVDKKHNNTDYVMYSINSDYFRKNAIANSTGSTRLRIGLNELKSLPILIPKLEEQEKIASILLTVDKQIDNVDTLIEKNKELKKGLMQTLLTKGIGHTKLKKTEVGEVPEEWDIIKLGELAQIKRGASPRPINNPKWFSEKKNVGWIRISDVTKTKKYLNSTEQYLSDEGIAKSRLVKPNDLIMSICATVGKPIILNMSACIHDGFILFDDLNNNKIITDYLYYLLQKKEEEFKGMGQTGTQANLNTNIVGSTLISIPTIEEQEKIVLILSEADKKIDEYENKKQKLKELKNGLMQQLLSGNIRVI